MRESDKPGILADSPVRARSRTGLLFVGLGLSLAVVSALATVPGRQNDVVDIRSIVEPLAAPVFTVAQGDTGPFVRIERIQAGDTLSNVLARLDTSSSDVIATMTASKAGSAAIRSLRPGRAISATITPDGQLQSLDVPVSERGMYRLERIDGRLKEVSDEDASGTLTRLSAGRISSSLFAAADAAGLPDAVTMKMAEIFGTEIDFHTDIREGDEFSVLYEANTRNGAEVGVSRILAADFVNNGRRYAVIHFVDSDGNEGYYTPEGRNLKQAFLRSPLEFSRVTSGFKMRFHPIKKTWRQHTGVDFGAARGTAIKATSNGKVEFVGSKRGYGNTVVLRHRNKISTLYAHMSGFARGLRPGQSVSQGDVIGYVGSTGWATGPHLHYEFRRNNQPTDPLQVALPKAEPLEESEMARFGSVATERLAQLATLNYSRELASR